MRISDWSSDVCSSDLIVKIGTARALQQVSGGGRLVAKLTRCPGDEGARQQAVIAPDARVGSKVGVAHRCADAEPAVSGGFDPVERQAANVDEVRRCFYLELHEVEEVGPPGDEARAGHASEGGGRGGGRVGPLIGEAPHASTPATSVIASMMLE